jgi:hypothetical protein
MIPKILEEIKPEYPGAVSYSKPDEGYLIGPDSQHTNRTAFETQEPTCPLDFDKNQAWAREIRQARGKFGA